MKTETLKLAKILGLTEEDMTQAVEQYKATGQVLNRAVAVEMGLVEY